MSSDGIVCNCCGYKTLASRTGYEICPVCGWEDEGVSSLDGTGGANPFSLRQARRNYRETGASFGTLRPASRVRAATPSEGPPLALGDEEYLS